MRRILLSAVLAIAAAAPGRTGVVSDWHFNGTAVVPVTTQAPGVSASNLTMTGLTQEFSGDTLFFMASGWPAGGYTAQYFEWTVTPNPGYAVDYTSGTMHYSILTYPTFTHEIRSSVDGFTAAIASHTSSPGQPVYDDPLAVLGVQSGAVTFRLYGLTDSGPSGFYASYINITADDGAVYEAVPEPASLGLVAGLMSLGFVTLKRSPAYRRLLRSSR